MSAETVTHIDDDAFDLDALANEANKVPFRFKVDGSVFALIDPMDLDWTVIEDMQAEATAGHFKRVFELLVDDPNSYRDLLHKSIPTWKLVELFSAWSAHYGVSLGESSASSPRSARTRRR